MDLSKLLSSWFLIICLITSAQNDTIFLTTEIPVDTYKKPSEYINSTKSVSVAGAGFQAQNPADRLLESLNLLPGIRMEERSPGSFRLSVRGSTLRSPFGVRNVKVYLNDFILTDVTGNTYLQLIDPGLINRTEIFKGPEGGDFGAVTGGTVILNTPKEQRRQVGLSAGSFGQFKQSLNLSGKLGKHNYQLFQSWYSTDSYREQAAVTRKSIYLSDDWNYSDKSRIDAMLLFTDLHYETPGGLTDEQMYQNRRQARLATATLPGAVEQQTGIYNKTIMAGLSHMQQFATDMSHFVLIQGSYTDLRNPFITNYEKRFESNFAGRTHLNWEKTTKNWYLQSRLGYEGGFNKSIVRNFDNAGGSPESPQRLDEINTNSGFFFLSQKVEFSEKLFTDASVSFNHIRYNWENVYPEAGMGEKKFKKQWLPNLGISYLIKNGFSVRGKLGKGISPPTSEEIRSSTQMINTVLEPEYGWSAEIGIRKQIGRTIFLEAGYFDFRLKDAIVRQENESGQEYFVNAGGTVQKGVELMAESRRFNLNSYVLNNIKLWFSGSFFDFTFKDYNKGGENFSGNQLTGVPSASFQNLIQMTALNVLDISFSNFYTSSMFLNDANSVESDASWIGNLIIGYPVSFHQVQLHLQIGIRNLYNIPWVAGFDINAFGGRYYNPAASRTLDVQLRLDF